MTDFAQIPAEFNIEVVAGEDVSIAITLTANAVAYPFTATTLTAFVYRLTDMQAGRKSPTPLATLSAVSAGDGNLIVSTTDTVTGTTLGPGRFAWACEATAAGITRVIVSGEFVVDAKVLV